ncbi:hypothetical protein TIFTF001_025390 [Ficus carica]|uniref:Uncharacterized protein n=1 Tax=Ficus carica TaxID=3494 RepID=A0AA88AP33_FICCA|nr:hypothetical protein TIFTF001_025390 [Ficus carica]
MSTVLHHHLLMFTSLHHHLPTYINPRLLHMFTNPLLLHLTIKNLTFKARFK